MKCTLTTRTHFLGTCPTCMFLHYSPKVRHHFPSIETQANPASSRLPQAFVPGMGGDTVVSGPIWTNLVPNQNVILFFKIFVMAKLGLLGVSY